MNVHNQSQIISYSISDDTQRFCNDDIYSLAEQISDQLTKIETNTFSKDEIPNSSFFKSFLSHLNEDNENKDHVLLKRALREILPKVIEELPEDVQDIAYKIQAILNLEKTNSQETRIDTAEFPPLPKTQSIFQQLKKRELKPHPRMDSKAVENQLFVQNIEKGNFVETSFCHGSGRRDSVWKFEVQGNFLLTRTVDEVKIWNLETKNCLMTIPTRNITQDVKITEKYVLFNEGKKIRIFDFIECKKEQSIDCSDFISKFCIKNMQIFCLLSDNSILEGNIGSKSLKKISNAYPYKSNDYDEKFLVSERFLIQLNDSNLIIYDLQKNNKKFVKLNPNYNTAVMHLPRIINVCINNDFLICGFHSFKFKEKNPTYLCVIDLDGGQIINQYQEKCLEEETEDVQYYSAWDIRSDGKWTFFTHSNQVIGVNLAEKKHIIIDKYDRAPGHLFIEGQQLIHISIHHHHEINIKCWDIKSMKKSAELKVSVGDSLGSENIFFQNGKFYWQRGRSLVQWDFIAKGIDREHPNEDLEKGDELKMACNRVLSTITYQ